MLLKIKKILELADEIKCLSNEDGLEILNEEYTAAAFSFIKVGRALEVIGRKAEEIALIIRRIGKYYEKRSKTND